MAHAVEMSARERSPRLDLWFAVAAGPGQWLDGERLHPVDQLVVAGGLASALALGLAVTTTARTSLEFDGVIQSFLFGLTLAALLVVLFTAGSRMARFGSPAVVLARTAAGLGVLAMTVRAYGSVEPLVLSGFGLAGGAHATVTLRAIGADLRWQIGLRRFLTSTVHAGVLTGAVLLALLPPTRSLRGEVVDLGLAFYAVLATSTLTMAVLRMFHARIEASQADHTAALRSAIHRDHAHWLHDDVCSELGYLRLRLQNGAADPAALQQSIDELDHRLRVRQIDEILEGGPARLGEIMQPYIRVAQTNGVELTEVPTYETGAMLLPPDAGRQVQRAMGVLTANAIQAGARRIAIRTWLEAGGLVVEVEDDAGGFDVSRRIPGRGLDGLSRDLGADRLELVPTDTGTAARAHVAMAIEATVAV
jgi:hypothetical protein